MLDNMSDFETITEENRDQAILLLLRDKDINDKLHNYMMKRIGNLSKEIKYLKYKISCLKGNT